MINNDAGSFFLLSRRATCGELVTELPELYERTAILAEPTDRAVILGSMQSIGDEQRRRCTQAGFSVVKRRSGGGAVVIDPGQVFWLDFFVPPTDPLFLRDVRQGSFWVGDLWTGMLLSLGFGADSLATHREGVMETQWSKQCCFLGVGPGEVCVGERKIVGLSQRRSRRGAWFFTLVYHAMDAARDGSLLAPTMDDRTAIAHELETNVALLSTTHEEVVTALDRALALW